MISRIKPMFVAIAIGVLPLMALAFLSPPAAAASIRNAAPGGRLSTNCQTALWSCATTRGASGPAAVTGVISDTQALESSDKVVNRATSQPGQPLEYTISVSNAGTSGIGDIVVTDTLPAELIFTNGSLTATDGSFGYASGVITWTGSVNAGSTVAIQFEAASLPNDGMGTIITNTAIISGNAELISRSAATTLVPATLYLPLVARPQPGIQGHITQAGAPAAGVFLELRLFNGQAFSTQLSTNTDANGNYNFSGAPSLPPGQYYYVRYLNTGGTPGRLWFWGTANIASYSAGSAYAAGDFDVADLPLVSPPNQATVGLPSVFQWARRPASSTDSYQLALFDPNGSAFGQTGLLGYVNGVTLTGVPSIFHAGTPYAWEVLINSPDGGGGTSYEARWVMFSNTQVGSQPAVAGGAEVAQASRPTDRPRP